MNDNKTTNYSLYVAQNASHFTKGTYFIVITANIESVFLM